MRKLFLIPLLLIFLSCQSQDVIGVFTDPVSPPPAHVTGINFSGKTTVFIGNSITAGVYVTDPPNLRWTSLFSVARGTTQDNDGISGQVMQAGGGCGFFDFNPSAIPTYNSGTHAALIIGLGLNDCGYNNGTYTPTAFKTAYTTAITTALTTKGWPPDRVILLSLYKPIDFTNYVSSCGVSVAADFTRAADYNTKISEVASENGCWYADVWTAMNGLTTGFFMPDKLHPNDSGHQVIADFLIDYL